MSGKRKTTMEGGLAEKAISKVTSPTAPYSCTYRQATIPTRGASPTDSRAEAVRTVKEAQGLDFIARTVFASSAAWSPNPDKPPFFFNLPTKTSSLTTIQP
jgi:hypothetical protein